MAATTESPVPVDLWSDEYGPELERHVGRMLGNPDEARDVVQELWVTALRVEPDWGDGSNIRAWLYRVATRRALDVLSSKRRRAGLLSARSTELAPDRPPAWADRLIPPSNVEWRFREPWDDPSGPTGGERGVLAPRRAKPSAPWAD